MKKARFKNAMSSMNAASLEIKEVYQTVIEDLKAEIKNSLLAELKQEIQGGFNKLSPAVLSPVPRHFQFRSRITPKRSRDEEASEPAEQPAKIFCGTGQAAGTLVGGSSTRTEGKFWLYLTKISPEVQESDIELLVKERLKTTDVTVKSLVPKGRPLSELSFMSFKVGVHEDLKPNAMDPATWPQGIQFREFIDHGSNTRLFWKPAPRFDPGTTLSNPPMQLSSRVIPVEIQTTT